MRGTPAIVALIMGLPVAAFVTTSVLTDGAPLRAPGHGAEKAAVAGPEPGHGPEERAAERPVAAAAGALPPHRVAGSTGGPADEALDEWDRLAARAAQGDRDALLFLTLMGMTERHPLARRRTP